MKTRILAEAEEEAQNAAHSYENLRLGLGNQFLDAVKHALETIEQHPLLFPRVETLPSDRDVRRYVLRRFPYVVIYEIRAEEVIVLAIAHARRRPNYWRRRHA